MLAVLRIVYLGPVAFGRPLLHHWRRVSVRHGGRHILIRQSVELLRRQRRLLAHFGIEALDGMGGDYLPLSSLRGPNLR